MAIYSELSYLKMVIFHSYVSLLLCYLVGGIPTPLRNMTKSQLGL